MLMKNIFIKVLLLIIFFSNNWAFGQSFEKKIDSNFNGSIIYCSEINDSYLFLGYQIENNQTKLCCFKTDKSGNVILKNNSILINNVYFKYAIDNDNNILITDGDKLIKINSNFEKLWVKTIIGTNNIIALKACNNGKYIMSGNGKIFQTDSSGVMQGVNINYNYSFVDFDMINDTLYLLQASHANNTISYTIVLQKYDALGNLIIEKTVNGYRPQILVVNKKENKCLVFADIPIYKRTTFAVIEFNDNFSVISSFTNSFHNLWITLYSYNNNSFLIGGDYDGNGAYDVILAQMDNTLSLKLNYGTKGGYYTNLYSTVDGYILASYSTSFISKIKGAKLTSIENKLESKGLDFFPNPFSEHSVVKFDFAENVSMEIYDAQGKLIFTNIYLNTEQIEISYSDLPNTGLYFFRIQADGNYYSGKLLKN